MRRSNKLVFGIGIRDNISTRDIKGKILHSYTRWVKMLERCYSPKYLSKYESYIGCTVCDEWKLYSNFKKWFDANYIEGYVLDKDIIIDGNKVYSPDTCCFIPTYINLLFNRNINNANNKKLNKDIVGVHFFTRFNKYQVYISRYGKRYHLGYFDNETHAHNAWLKAKRDYARELAINAYMNNEIDERIMNAIIKKAYNLT